MRPALALMAASLVIALSGCTSETPGPAAHSADPLSDDGTLNVTRTAIREAITITECRHADLYIPIETKAVAPYIPADFDVALAGFGPQPGPAALGFVGVLDCAKFEGFGESGKGVFAWVDVAVIPKTAGLAREDADMHLLRLEHFTLEGALQAAQAKLGDHHTLVSSIDVRLGPTDAGFTIGTSKGPLKGEASVSGAAPAAAFDGFVLREFGVADGGYSYVDVTVRPAQPSMGLVAGTLTSPAGSLAHSVFGDQAYGSLVTAEFGFSDGAMGFIPVAATR